MRIGKLIYTWKNALRGVLIYSIGDSIAALILGEYSVYRMLGLMLVGGTVYALEIPNYFRWIDHMVSKSRKLSAVLKRTGMAMAYFNPLWIARHLLFIQIFSGRWNDIGWGLLHVAAWSFVVNIPISFTGNYVIQNKIPYDWRFVSSAVFSSLMAIYYALSMVLF